jgi:transcriptional regulator with XRE-family HTH domain
MIQLGQDLKRERELRGVSLREIADSTRISLRYLEALEDDRLDVIPGRFFVRAILRSYAKAIGLDETQLLKRYDESTQFNEQLEYTEAGTAPQPARTGPRKWAPAAIGILALVIAVPLLYVFVFSPREEGRPPQKAQASAAPAEDVPAPVTAAPTPSPALPAEAIKDLRLDISFSEETWLQVYADGQLVWDGIKTAGESLHVRAERKLVLNSGNAGGMDFLLNGKKAQSLGPRGAVRKNVRITLDDYKEFLLPEGAG